MASYLTVIGLGRPVLDRLGAFLLDAERNTSAYLSAWLLATAVDAPTELPDNLITYARNIARDRNQPSFIGLSRSTCLPVAL